MTKSEYDAQMVRLKAQLGNRLGRIATLFATPVNYSAIRVVNPYVNVEVTVFLPEKQPEQGHTLKTVADVDAFFAQYS